MIVARSGLTAADFDGLAALERRVVAADGGRLKLEWDVLRGRARYAGDGAVVHELLWLDGARLIGFVGLYAFTGSTVELVGAVDPAHRRRAIGSALLAAALAVVRERGLDPVLLVAAREPAAGGAFARHHGGVLEHSEHALALTGPPADARHVHPFTLRAATPEDAAAVVALLHAGFGRVPARLAHDITSVTVAEQDGVVIAALRTTRDGEDAGVHGFVVDPARRGRGIGREVLRRVCGELRAGGARTVRLEVAVDNAHALGLYTSLGFVRVTTEDYWTLPSRPAASG